MSNSEAKPTNEKSEPTILTLETAKEIAEMLKDGKSLKEIRKSISHHGHSINAWISESLLSDDIDHPLSDTAHRSYPTHIERHDYSLAC